MDISLDAVVQKVKEIIANQFDLKAEDIKGDAEFKKDLGADSLSMVEMAMAIEDAFETEEIFSDDDLDKIVTVQNAIDHVFTYFTRKGAAS